MNNNESLAHTKWDCTYHIVWIPKYRRKVLYGDCGKEVKDVLKTLVEAKDGVEIVEGSVCSDHIHVCLCIAPKHSVSKVMGYLKGKSSLVLFDHHPEWRKITGRDRTFWARGYFVSTVGVNETVIRKYVRDQEDASRMVEWVLSCPAALPQQHHRSESCVYKAPGYAGGLLLRLVLFLFGLFITHLLYTIGAPSELLTSRWTADEFRGYIDAFVTAIATMAAVYMTLAYHAKIQGETARLSCVPYISMIKHECVNKGVLDKTTEEYVQLQCE